MARGAMVSCASRPNNFLRGLLSDGLSSDHKKAAIKKAPGVTAGGFSDVKAGV
jgi:hypothetical protein